jgi:hypothetical protein
MDPKYEESFILDIQNALKEHKILPLQIDIDLHSIKKYFWTITGTFMTTEPLTRDDLQTIIVNINNELKFRYSPDKVNFNTAINYREVIETILNLDNRILTVDLDPIQYEDDEGQALQKEDLVSYYTKKVPILDNPDPEDNLVYDITLPNIPILPGSVMVRVDHDSYVLRDNNNGDITNAQNRLTKDGTIDYQTGDIHLEFTSPVSELKINYTKNQVNIATYKNLSTQNFYFDSTSLKQEQGYNLV